MEKRQLNYSAPLLSARRYSSPTRFSEFVKRNSVERPPPDRPQSLSLSKSDWESEQLTKPAAVPFHWEHAPGKPKGEVHTPEEPLNTPKLPPARISDTIRRNSGEIFKLPPGKVAGLSRYNSGEIPRLLTGRMSGSSAYNSGERSSDPSIFKPQVETFSFIDHASLLAKLNESLNNKDSDSESEVDAYSDALDTLSRTESSSFNYSVSGLSGYQSSGVKPSGTFSVDSQTREFMMNRFLPAAKAVILETPQYVVKKPSVGNEQPKQQRIKKATSREIKPLLEPHRFYALPGIGRSTDFADSEDEKESPHPLKKSGKVWGIFPRFCVKNSLCLFNPLPGMKLKTHIPKPDTPKKSSAEVGRMVRSRNALSGPLEKNSCHVPSNKKFHSGLLPRELLENEKKLAADANLFLSSLEIYKPGPSPLRHNRSGNISPYRNESPKSPFHEGTGFLGVPKQVEKDNAKKIASSLKLFKAMQDVSRNQLSERGAGLPGDAIDKTKCMDAAIKRDLTASNLSITKPEVFLGLAEERKKFFADRRSAVDNNATKLNTLDERKNHNQISRSTEKVQIPSIRNPKFAVDAMKYTEVNQSLNNKPSPVECTELPSDRIIGIKHIANLDSNVQEDFDPSSLKSPLPPPLPKSPSESWLWCTHPAVTLSKPFSHSRSSSPIHSRKQVQKVCNSETKWETIVKASNLQNEFVRYSEELIPHISH